ncbi:hypothetical protein REC12_00170 [Desulfosporosinus sp. PR]|uniref:hypothetical protein n=1 Tax=Candidatus Desulfosporosinus nitrosoreducens TaxID=3401928 RepID=UPI0027ED150B|nr:hypothetical protein [Desulfosporosinus sp. PR]MDQ7092009.1 hypothetical protein [Desulfosporosinus sp. PR]
MTIDVNYVFWPGLAVVLGIPTLIFIPRPDYKKFLIFGFVLGGVVDVMTIIFLGNLLGEFSYLAGPLQAFGIPIFIPISFTFVWMLFLFFLPFRMEFLIPYIIGFSGFSVILGFIEQNLGFFKYNYGTTHGAITTTITFVVWFTGTTLIYRNYYNKLPA